MILKTTFIKEQSILIEASLDACDLLFNFVDADQDQIIKRAKLISSSFS